MSEEKQKSHQLELFREHLPNRPYCSNSKGFQQIRGKAIAVLQKYIQHNQPTKKRWLVFDYDKRGGVLEHIQQESLPAPNLIASNPANQHAHLFYMLNSPVCDSVNARRHPLDLLAKIQHVLTERLGADAGYAGHISKNVLSDAWEVQEVEKTGYDLGDFLEWFDIPAKLPHRAKLQGFGRNCTLFETAKKWAYRQVLAYRVAGKQEAFIAAVLGHCEQINETFNPPLPFSEVKATAKSIAKWTWSKYTARWTDQEFSEIQANRGKKGGLVGGRGRSSTDLEKRLKARSMRSEGMTQATIAKALEVNQATISRWLK